MNDEWTDKKFMYDSDFILYGMNYIDPITKEERQCNVFEESVIVFQRIMQSLMSKHVNDCNLVIYQPTNDHRMSTMKINIAY